MYTIFDYLKYNKDIELKDLSWNTMDNLFCAMLVYNNLDNVRTFDELCNRMTTKKVPSKLDFQYNDTKAFFESIKGSKRYRNLKIKNYVNIKNKQTQFNAVTFIISNIKVICFKGTDGSPIGWLENFRLAYEYPTYTQKLAIEYLKKNIHLFGRKTYVVGHSKGGNLALVSAMELQKYKFNKIIKVLNFDGPGLQKEVFNTDKFNRLKEKLDTYVPETSTFGMLLYNDDYTVIKSCGKGINVHNIKTWLTYGPHLIEGTLSSKSKKLHTLATEKADNIDKEKFKSFIEETFESFEKNNIEEIDLMLKSLIKMAKSANQIDLKTKKYVVEMIFAMIGGKKKRKKE